MAKIYQFADLRFRLCEGSPDEQVEFNGNPLPDCIHKRITLDENGQIITCDDCGKQLEAWWVVNAMLRRYKAADEQLRQLQEKVKEGAREMRKGRLIQGSKPEPPEPLPSLESEQPE